MLYHREDCRFHGYSHERDRVDCSCKYDENGRPTDEMVVHEEREAHAKELTDFQVKFMTEATAVMNGEDQVDEDDIDPSNAGPGLGTHQMPGGRM